MSGKLLTAEEVAELLAVSKDWIYSETRAGRIPHVKLGRYRRYRREAIEAWLEDIEVTGSHGGERRKVRADTRNGRAAL